MKTDAMLSGQRFAIFSMCILRCSPFGNVAVTVSSSIKCHGLHCTGRAPWLPRPQHQEELHRPGQVRKLMMDTVSPFLIAPCNLQLLSGLRMAAEIQGHRHGVGEVFLSQPAAFVAIVAPACFRIVPVSCENIYLWCAPRPP